jgi:tetratricopeptide (TPR) repeat protein
MRKIIAILAVILMGGLFSASAVSPAEARYGHASNRSAQYNNRGYEYNKQGDYDRAIQDFDEAIRLDPRNQSAYNNRGWAYFRKGDYDRAIQDYDEAIRIDPKKTIPFNNRGDAYTEKGDYDRAIRDFEEAIWLDSKNYYAYGGRGLAYMYKGDYDRAIQDFDQALHLERNFTYAYNNRGWSYLRKHDYDRAILDFDDAIKLAPNFAAPYSNRGEAFFEKGDFDAAIQNFNEAIRLDPNMTVAYVKRGFCYEKKGDLDRARADYGTAVTRPPGRYVSSEAALVTARERLAALDTRARPVALPQVVPAPEQQKAGPETDKPPSEHGPRVALVIGNGAYTSVDQLPNPPNDARDVAAALRELGFKVIEGYNLDGTTMRRKIAEFGAVMSGAGVTLFFYAGHGMQVAGKNYLLPVDAKLERPSSLGVEAIEVNTVLADMESEKRINLVFLDACRDNPMARTLARSFGSSRSASVGQGLAQLSSNIGTLITFATSPDSVALDDGNGRNSPFTAALLKHIRTPGLEVRSMLTRVRAEVIQLTHERQVPWDHSSLTGEFYFKPGG